MRCWNLQILHRSLRCIVSANKVIKIQKPTQDWFWQYIIASGLEPLVRTNFNVLDYGLLWAFAERWHPETSTFHLPIGEMGITLDDVQCLLHISIQGKFLNHVKISRPDGAQMLSTYLGIDEGDAMDMFAALKGPYLTHSYVQGLFMDYLDTAESAFANNAPMHEVRMYRERCVRAFLLFVVGCTIFSNKSSYYLDVVYIQYFADLSSVHEWNWGSAALVQLQNYLDFASQAQASQLAGYMSFFEVKIYDPSIIYYVICVELIFYMDIFYISMFAYNEACM